MIDIESLGNHHEEDEVEDVEERDQTVLSHLECFCGFESVGVLKGIFEIVDLLLSEVNCVKTQFNSVENEQNNTKCVNFILCFLGP